MTPAPINLLLNHLKGTCKVISENELITSMDVGDLVNNTKLKRSVLVELENQYNNLLVYGNTLLDRSICDWIVKRGGKIVVILELNPQFDFAGAYFENLDRQVILDQFKAQWCNPSIEGIEYWTFDDTFHSHIKDYTDWIIDSIKLTGIKDTIKEVKDTIMTMEETIRQAKEKLGIFSSQDEGITEEQSSSVMEPETPILSVSEKVEVDTFEEQISSIFLKIKDGTIALLVPQDKLLKLPVKNINGKSYVTLSFRAPDLGNTQLQKLNILNEVSATIPLKKGSVSQETTQKSDSWVDNLLEKTKPQLDKLFPDSSEESKPIPKSKPSPIPEFKSNDLKELEQEKERLTKLIAEARKVGDNEKVTELRRQRRSIRKKINACGSD